MDTQTRHTVTLDVEAIHGPALIVREHRGTADCADGRAVELATDITTGAPVITVQRDGLPDVTVVFSADALVRAALAVEETLRSSEHAGSSS